MGSRRFEGRHVFITGAGSGFGRRTAERFAEEGAAIIHLVDRVQTRLDSVAAVVEDVGARAHRICVDLADPDVCAESIDRALAAHPRLDVVISNAAAWADEPFIETTFASWRHILAVDLDASFVLANRAANSMRHTGGGTILFTSSISSLGHGRGFTSYAVAKAGLVALAKAIAVECAPDGIRANCVSPGPGDTQQSIDLTSAELVEKWRTEGFPAVPMNRLASVDDIAGAFLFLASDDARYITGVNLVVDGGLTAQMYDVPDS